MPGAGAKLEPFSVTSEQRGDAAYLRVSGEIDMMTAPLLDQRLREAQSNGYSGIVVDLERVTFMDASGLRPLLRAAGEARRSNKTFATIKTCAIVNRVLQVTGATELLGAGSLAPVTSREAAGRIRGRSGAPTPAYMAKTHDLLAQNLETSGVYTASSGKADD